MKKVSITLVLYNNDINMIKNTITSCMQDIKPSDIYVVDNSTNINLKIIESFYKINYLKNINKGFGNGHNQAFTKFNLIKNYEYNLVLNPDITFEKHTLKKLITYLDKNPDVGALMPKILNLDGSLQFARRCLPTPIHLIYKRIFPNSKISIEYEIKNFEPKVPIELIGICGCFMLLRLKVIKKTQLFDERFFMYFEDFDLARRISLSSKVIYYPLEKVFHGSERGHKKSLTLLFFLINSAIKYFLKWGVVDDYRKKTNTKLLREIKSKNAETC
jgi:GT2 family glycosyltransferase